MAASDLAVTRRRVAFIVGNDEYQYLPRISNSVKDAELISTTLKNIGFETDLYRNLTTRELKYRFLDFFDNVQDNSLVFFYFNGHGIEHSIDYSKDNYLLGIEVQEDSMMLNEYKNPGLPLRKLIQKVRDRFVMIIVLDAERLYLEEDKRYSPRRNSGRFDSIMTYEVGQPNPDRLLQLDFSPENTNIVNYQVDIVYACQPGYFAIEDRESANGYLARALHHSLNKAGGWRDAIQEATAQVYQETLGRQKPSAEMNIMYKLEIKRTGLAATSQRPNIDITTEIPSTSSAQFGLEIPDILRKQIQNGMLENENFELVEEEDDILVNLKNSPDEVTIKGLKIQQIFSQGCRYLVVRLRPQQKINFLDCEFFGIGLRIETSSELNPSGDVVVNNFKLESEFGFDFENIESASMEKIFVQNCVKSGFRLKNIQLVTMKDVYVSDCSVGIDGNDVKAVNCDNLLVQRCVFGFGIQKCDGELTNCEFKECDVQIYQVSGKFQHNP